MNRDLIKRESVESLVLAAADAIRDATEAHRLLTQANARLEAALGGHYSCLTRERNDIWNEDAPALIRRSVTEQGWRAVIQHTGIFDLVSCAKRTEIDTQLSKGSLPDLTVENVFAFLDDLMARTPELLQQSVQEVFELLRPPRSKLKTNTEYEIGKKVILHWGGCYKWDITPQLSYYHEQHVRALDNVFHMLDGKGVAHYPGNLLTAFRQMRQDRKREFETEYFQVRAHLNNSVHVRFKRMDLVQKLNQMAGGNRLKHASDAAKCE